jgi:hypothetical protein
VGVEYDMQAGAEVFNCPFVFPAMRSHVAGSKPRHIKPKMKDIIFFLKMMYQVINI